MKAYFTDFSYSKGLFYACVLTYTIACALIVVFEPLLLPEYCSEEESSSTSKNLTKIEYPNPAYRTSRCLHIRLPQLIFLTPKECEFGRRLVMSVLLGGIIGWERRQADRPAGIRTMSLVSLGSCLFTINSAFAFLDGPMTWDASRIAAAIPSGVGFLGAGLIFKEAEKDQESGNVTHIVHGLTTSASLWLSAAVGVACGGELYFAATFTVALLLTLLRFGPRFEERDEEAKNNEGYDNEGFQQQMININGQFSPKNQQYHATIEIPKGAMDEEASQMTNKMGEMDTLFRKSERTDRTKSERTKSVRKRAHLGGIV